MEINKQYTENIMYILIVVFILVSILLLMKLYDIDLNTVTPKKLLQVITIEGMEDKDNKNGKKCKYVCDDNNKKHNKDGRDGKDGKDGKNKKKGKGGKDDNGYDINSEPLLLTPADFLSNNLVKSFCSTFQTSSSNLEQQCNRLTKSNCNAASCCVLLNGQKCVAGSANGPTFQSDSQGNPINIDYYYYQNKCYGNNCPSTNMASQLLQLIQ